MQRLLKYIDAEYLSSLGEHKFSEISRISIGLSMVYIDKIKQQSLKSKPLLFGFPNKKWLTVWLAAGILNNLFYRESLNINENWIEQLDLKKNDRIEIFGKSSRWIGKKNNRWMIEVSQSSPNAYGKIEKSTIEYELPSTWASFVNLDKSSRTSTISVKSLNKELKERRGNQTALEKILFHSKNGKNLGLNPEALKSKVLIVTGRGDKGRFIRQLKETKIYNESLSSVFGFEKNLVVEVDLEKYKGIGDPDFDNRASHFQKRALRLLSHILRTEPDLEKEIKVLQNKLDKSDFLNESFLSDFEIVKNEADEDNQKKIENVLEKHPGIRPGSNFKFDAVVINDVAILNEYSNLINSFFEMRIPVITVTDFYSEFDAAEVESDDYYRFFWGSSKLFCFSESNEEFVDTEAWQLAKRFNDQFVDIVISDDDAGIEELFSQLTRNIYDVDGYEELKKEFWNSLFPVYHLVKNTPGSISFDQIKGMIQNFRDELGENPLPSYPGERVKKIISLLENEFKNTKTVAEDELIFRQSIVCCDHKLGLPNDGQLPNKTVNLTGPEIQKVLFTGEPYKEKYSGELKKACLSDFIKNVKILCWPREGIKVTDYLWRSYRSKFYTDNFNPIFEVSEKNIIRNSRDIEAEINEIISVDRSSCTTEADSKKVDDLFDKLRSYKHSVYRSKEGNDDSVEANIITFDNSDWMYLPKNSSILAANYFHDGKLNVRKYKFSELTPGLQIIQYSLDRDQLRKMGRKDLHSVFDRLDMWRTALENSFEKSGNNYPKLEATLSELKGESIPDSNPSKVNLIRWRKDNELLAPNDSNLSLILLADKKTGLLEKVSKARRLVRKFDNSVRKEIKSGIIKKLESVSSEKVSQESFEIKVKGFSVSISPRTILSKDDQTIEVSYSQTKKIMSD